MSQDAITLHRSTRVPRPLEEVFAFFSDARNLEAITPPWLSFRIVNPEPIVMRPGTRIDYALKVHGIPFRWQSEITVWEPLRRFVDEQRRGPYRLWSHEHRFEEKPDGTEVIDSVRYSVWGGRLVDRLFVAPDVRRIFDHRQERIRYLLGPAVSSQALDRP